MSDRRNRPPNRWGCKPDEDVCVEHDRPLICRHTCPNGKYHQCKGQREQQAEARAARVRTKILEPHERRGKTMLEPVLLPSGYYHIQLGPQCWARWPRGEKLRRKHIFDPEWNEKRVMEWYKKWSAVVHSEDSP